MTVIALAIVHGDPPQVFAAEDMDVLHWVLALKVVGATDPRTIPGRAGALQQALLEERWADAVVDWMSATGNVVDVFDYHELYTPSAVDMAPSELQFLPLFRDNID